MTKGSTKKEAAEHFLASSGHQVPTLIELFISLLLMPSSSSSNWIFPLRRWQIPAFQRQPKCLFLISFLSWADTSEYWGAAVPSLSTNSKHESNGFNFLNLRKDPLMSLLGGQLSLPLLSKTGKMWQKWWENVSWLCSEMYSYGPCLQAPSHGAAFS